MQNCVKLIFYEKKLKSYYSRYCFFDKPFIDAKAGR